MQVIVPQMFAINDTSTIITFTLVLNCMKENSDDIQIWKYFGNVLRNENIVHTNARELVNV